MEGRKEGRKEARKQGSKEGSKAGRPASLSQKSSRRLLLLSHWLELCHMATADAKESRKASIWFRPIQYWQQRKRVRSGTQHSVDLVGEVLCYYYSLMAPIFSL